MGFIKDFFSFDYHRLKKLRKLLKKINAFAPVMAALSDEELQEKTTEFRRRLSKGETLDDLLPEAYAVVREADKRILGMFPYDVQVLGAIVLHQGNLAEMRTGEGKTLTATMPLYLNGLTGKGAMLVTPSEYLAKRDAEEMGPVYRFLGLTVGLGVFEEKKVKAAQKRKMYESDIIYTTNSILGFDYLSENLASSSKDKFMRPFHYAIIDEADAILLDAAQTPLIISGAPRLQSNFYKITDQFIQTLKEGVDYHFDREDKEVWITKTGIDEAEKFFRLENLFTVDRTELVRHLVLALKAHLLFEVGKQYVVADEKVLLLDRQNGRALEGMKLQGGQHQAIEAKEEVKLTDETRAMASITYQNLFLMFDKLAGMTGSGKTEESEFIEIYNMEVICIPTNKPVQRIDLPDLVYTTLPEKITASVELIKKIHATGQPILLITGSVTMSELYSEILLLEGIPHNLLNAHNAPREAAMIAEAGQLNNVTVATNMAGRGTDIKLGEGVAALGGLAVIGTERMSNKRMDVQLRGRAGRQGDPGFSQFFVSLEDDILVDYGGKWIRKYYRDHHKKVDANNPVNLTDKRIRKSITAAQEASSSFGRSSRKMTLDFDGSIKVQRDYVYKERDAIIANSSDNFDINRIIKQVVQTFVSTSSTLDEFSLSRYIFDNISYDFECVPKHFDFSNSQEVTEYLIQLIYDELDRKKQQLGDDYPTFERISVLKAIDEAWIEEVDYLQQLRTAILSRGSRNPILEYHRESLLAYEKMKTEIRRTMVKNLMLSQITYTKKKELSIFFT